MVRSSTVCPESFFESVTPTLKSRQGTPTSLRTSPCCFVSPDDVRTCWSPRMFSPVTVIPQSINNDVLKAFESIKLITTHPPPLNRKRVILPIKSRPLYMNDNGGAFFSTQANKRRRSFSRTNSTSPSVECTTPYNQSQSPFPFDSLNRSFDNRPSSRSGRAARCLFGNVNDEELRNLLDSELKQVSSQKSLEWNFDFENDEPIEGPNAQYEWMHINQNVKDNDNNIECVETLQKISVNLLHHQSAGYYKQSQSS